MVRVTQFGKLIKNHWTTHPKLILWYVDYTSLKLTLKTLWSRFLFILWARTSKTGKKKKPVKSQKSDFPGSAVVKNPPASAGDTGSSPGPGRSHMPREQLSPSATTTEPVLQSLRTTTTEPTCHNYWSPCTQSPCSPTREATAMRSPRTTTKSSPRSPQLEKACTQQQRPSAAQNK